MSALFFLTLVFAILANTALAQTNSTEPQQYLCVSDMANGFRYNEQSNLWEHAKFRPGSKWIIRRPEVAIGGWVYSEIGRGFRQYCDKNFDYKGNLRCNDDLELLEFNKNTLRYMRVYKFGYVSQSIGDTPLIEIGTCAAF